MKRVDELARVKQLVRHRRMEMPRLGTRKLYYFKEEFLERGLKIGRDQLFAYLRAEHLLIKPTMTDGSDCYQNALAERINGILKQEFLIYPCQTKKELKLLVKESIETYNNKRPHLSLSMKTPDFVHKKACEVEFTDSD